MPTTKAISSKASVGIALNYIEKREKTDGGKLIEGINCNIRSAIDEFEQVKNYYGKTEGRTYKHYVLSFDPKAEKQPTAQEAMNICKEIIQNTPHLHGFQAVVAVHTDREHTHAHIIVNSVNLYDGHKLNESKAQLTQMKKINDEICKAYGYEPPKHSQQLGDVRKEKKNAYKTIEKLGKESEIFQLWDSVRQAKAEAKNRAEFCELLKSREIITQWKENRKNIVFSFNGRKYRDSNLSKTFGDEINKESLENEFTANTNKQRIERPREIENSRGNNRAIHTENSEIDRIIEQTERELENFEHIEQPVAGLYQELERPIRESQHNERKFEEIKREYYGEPNVYGECSAEGDHNKHKTNELEREFDERKQRTANTIREIEHSIQRIDMEQQQALENARKKKKTITRQREDDRGFDR